MLCRDSKLAELLHQGTQKPINIEEKFVNSEISTALETSLKTEEIFEKNILKPSKRSRNTKDGGLNQFINLLGKQISQDSIVNENKLLQLQNNMNEEKNQAEITKMESDLFILEQILENNFSKNFEQNIDQIGRLLTMKYFESIENMISSYSKLLASYNSGQIEEKFSNSGQVDTILKMLTNCFKLYVLRMKYRVELQISMEYCNLDILNAILKVQNFRK